MILTALNIAGLQHRNSTNKERVWKKISSSCRKCATVALEEKRSLNSPFIRIKILSLLPVFKHSLNAVFLWWQWCNALKQCQLFSPLMYIFKPFLQHDCPEFIKLLCNVLEVKPVSTHTPFFKLFICAQLVLFKLRIEIISGFRDVCTIEVTEH